MKVLGRATAKPSTKNIHFAVSRTSPPFWFTDRGQGCLTPAVVGSGRSMALIFDIQAGQKQ